MKTILEIKNRNNFKATFLRLIAIFISIVLLSFTVSAQEFWNSILTNNSINEIAAVLVERSSTSTEKEKAKPTSLLSNSGFTISLPLREVIKEETLTIEEWMLDNTYFQAVDLEDRIEIEQPLDLEPWMQDENHFNNDLESEEKLQLESWMTDESRWG